MKRICISLLAQLSLFMVSMFVYTQPSHAQHIAPGTYWEWMNGNISQQGITEDLEYMKKAGYGGAMIFEAGVGIPRGPVDYRSQQWLKAVRHALSEAERLGMSIDMHNAPGYSGTGGPWITPEYSMKQLVWSEQTINAVKGEKRMQLQRPFAKHGFYRDICVLAYPVGAEKHDIVISNVQVGGERLEASILSDYELSTECHMEGGQTLVVELEQLSTLQSATVFRGRREQPLHPYDGPRDYAPQLQMEVSSDGMHWQHVGFFICHPLRALDAPCTLSFKPAEARYVRITTNRSTNLAELQLLSTPRLKGYASKAGYVNAAIPFEREMASEDVDVIALEDIVDLTEQMDSAGRLNMDRLETGKWAIVRIGYTTTGEEVAAAPDAGRGLECDKLNRMGVDQHFNRFLDPVLTQLAPWCGTTLQSLCIDSWEAGRQNWTESLPTAFRQRRGYNVTPWLLAATGHIVDSTEESERFLWDFRRTLADMFIDGYVLPFCERAARHHLRYSGEAYGDGPFESLEMQALQDVPMSEYWTHHVYGNITTTIMAASTANIYGKPIVACESFTGTPFGSKFTEHPYGMKATCDYLMTRGVTHFVYHATTHQPYTGPQPGCIMTMGPFGTHLDRNSTWAGLFAPFNTYVARCCKKLQEGRQVADLLYLKDESISSGIVNYYMTAPATPYGYRFDVAGVEAICQSEITVTANGSILFPSGMQYQLLIVPQLHRASPELLRHLFALARQGAHIMLPEQKPVGYMGLNRQKDTEVRHLADSLWASPSVLPRIDIDRTLRELGIEPDFSYTAENPDARIHFTHRQSESGDVYFICNQLRRPERLTFSCRIAGKQPIVWNPLTDSTYAPDSYTIKNGRTYINLSLDECGSVFIIFSDERPLLDNDFQPVVPMTTETDSINNTFTLSLWAKPETYALSGRGFLLYPAHGRKSVANVGLTMGQNGVTVVEHCQDRKTVLTYDGPIEGWTHIALVYQKGSPALWLNGRKVAEGKASGNACVPALHTPQMEEMNNVGFEGDQTPVSYFDHALNDSEIHDIFQTGLPAVYYQGERVLDLNREWNVSFPSWSKAPEAIVLDTLQSLHRHPDFNVRHFSGTAIYSRHFQLSARQFKAFRKSGVQLHLGRVENMAEVQINGSRDTLLWKPPFVLDITQLLQKGDNEITIRVTNLYPNRMIGDEYLPEENVYDQYGCILQLPEWYRQSKPCVHDRVLFCTWKYYKKDDPLLESGLLGPVGLYLKEKDK